MFMQANTDGVSLHSHLSEVIQELLATKSPSLDDLESISLEVKKKHFTSLEPAAKNPAVPAVVPSEAFKKRSTSLLKVRAPLPCEAPACRRERARPQRVAR